MDILRICVSSISPRFVQATDTAIYMHVGRIVEYLGQILDKLLTSMSREIVQCFVQVQGN